MKALLFVQTGDARPKCEGECWERMNDWGRRMRGTLRQRDLMRRSDRWWLVECETARHGREVIASGRTELRSGFGGDGSILIGRILASGGRS